MCESERSVIGPDVCLGVPEPEPLALLGLKPATLLYTGNCTQVNKMIQEKQLVMAFFNGSNDCGQIILQWPRDTFSQEASAHHPNLLLPMRLPVAGT